MRAAKLVLSTLAVAFALGGTAFAANTAASVQSETTQTSAVHAAPAKHRFFKRHATAAKNTKTAAAKANTANSSAAQQHSGR
jgi:hypothetical protein